MLSIENYKLRPYTPFGVYGGDIAYNSKGSTEEPPSLCGTVDNDGNYNLNFSTPFVRETPRSSEKRGVFWY
jgi:hypothetical protein